MDAISTKAATVVKPIASGLAGHTFNIKSVEVDERRSKKAKVTLK